MPSTIAEKNERDWKLLKDKLEQKFYSWDTTSFADGAYYLKIVASDCALESPRQRADRGARSASVLKWTILRR